MFTLRPKTKRDTVEFTISSRTVIRVLALVLVSILALAALRRAEHALVLIFTAFFLALALNGPVHWVAVRLPGKRRGSRAAATAISFFVVIAFLAGFLALIGPPLVRQTSNFISAAPAIVENARDQNSTLGQFITRYNLQGQVDKLSHQLSDRLGNIGGTALGGLEKLGSSIFSVLTILVLTFMMLTEGPRWLRFIRDLVPDEHHGRLDRLALDMYKVVKGYVNGQVVLAFIASSLLLPALIILHVSYPAALLVVVFVCGLIPLIGHTIGAVIVTTVALFHSPWAAIIILAYYILYQQIENYIIQPRIQANSTNMSPLLVFAAVIIGVSFGGLFGGLVAIPAMGCLRIFALDYLRSRHIIEESTYEDIAGQKKSAPQTGH
ncbi:MAG TPA: AI-2E family transporter [Candidatus Saccharimonadales bacterium]|nr:AI-2E family transporter [Candidatus Saccharimonadales bacterium]